MSGTNPFLGGQAAEGTTDNPLNRHPRDKLTILLYVIIRKKLQRIRTLPVEEVLE